MWNSDLELRGQFARSPAGRAESATSSPSFSSCRQCTLLDVFDGAAVSHAHQESVTTRRRRAAGWLVVSKTVSLSQQSNRVLQTKPSRLNAALSNSNEGGGDNGEIDIGSKYVMSPVAFTSHAWLVA